LPTRRSPSIQPRRAFVDSGAWIALASLDDAHHAAADAVFREAAEVRTKLVTTNLVLAEVHRFLLFRAGIRAAAATLDRIATSRLVVIEHATAQHHSAALGWLQKLHDQVVTYTDAVSFAVVTATRCEAVIGFDHDFVVAGFRLWKWPAR
jgi:predicted nucleic acid-binding protein